MTVTISGSTISGSTISGSTNSGYTISGNLKNSWEYKKSLDKIGNLLRNEVLGNKIIVQCDE